MPDGSTPLQQVSSQVDDSQLGHIDDDKTRRLNVIMAVAPRLREVAERIALIERAMAGALPEFIKEQPIGVVVDAIADIKTAIEVLHGDGSSVVTNMLKARLNYAREVSLPERLEHDKIKTFSTDDWRISRSTRVLASIPGEKRDEAYNWLRENDHGSLIKETVNASSLSALAKEIMEGGHELPEDLFNVHPKVSVSFTKVAKGRG